MSGRPPVVRLLTFVDVDDRHDDGPPGWRMSVSARHEAVLADGRRVVLLDDRGWSGELRRAEGGETVALPRPWAHETLEEIERTARFVVGPDEPFGGRTRTEMEASHWEYLAGILQHEGIQADAGELRALPHDVEVSDRVLARLSVADRDGI